MFTGSQITKAMSIRLTFSKKCSLKKISIYLDEAEFLA